MYFFYIILYIFSLCIMSADSPSRNTGVGCQALLQGIFPTQGLNPGFPHCRQILYHLSHHGSYLHIVHSQTWMLHAYYIFKREEGTKSYHNLSGLDGKESACNVGNRGSIPGLGRFPGVGNGKPLQYSCLGNPMDRGAWWATVHQASGG